MQLKICLSIPVKKGGKHFSKLFNIIPSISGKTLDRNLQFCTYSAKPVSWIHSPEIVINEQGALSMLFRKTSLSVISATFILSCLPGHSQRIRSSQNWVYFWQSNVESQQRGNQMVFQYHLHGATFMKCNLKCQSVFLWHKQRVLAGMNLLLLSSYI